ncbi:MAG: Holliday junction resolvase RuvX [Patescibacteria group bacterium]
MKKVLGLDIGQKRIGVAISSEKIISSSAVINNISLSSTLSEISQICRRENIAEIVIGIPKNRQTFQAQKIHKFALEITKNLNLPISYVDETLTSKEAERILARSRLNYTFQKYKEEIDKLSAKLILEQYLSQK